MAFSTPDSSALSSSADCDKKQQKRRPFVDL